MSQGRTGKSPAEHRADVGAGRGVVCVFGSGDPREEDAEYRTALAVGEALASLGYAIANGGYAGTMEASARGAVRAGGEVIGVTCSIWKSRPNRYLTHQVRTTSLSERVDKLIELGRCGYVCLPGATGTLVELAIVWEMMFKTLLPRRPLVCWGSFWRPVIDLMASAHPRCAGLISIAEDTDTLRKHFPA